MHVGYVLEGHVTAVRAVLTRATARPVGEAEIFGLPLSRQRAPRGRGDPGGIHGHCDTPIHRPHAQVLCL